MDGLFRDLRYAVRTLLKSPAFTVVAVLTLALGIGMNSGMFSVVNTVLLRPLPYPDADRIVTVHESYSERGEHAVAAAPRNFRDWHEQNRSFAALAAYRQQNLILTGQGESERLQSLRVSADFFRVYGVNPALGRGFVEGEDEPGGRAVVLSSGLWQQRFGSDPGVVGRTITLNDESFEIVGVMPAGFRVPGWDAALWATPAWPEPARDSRGAHMLNAVGRLNAGVSVEQAGQEMSAMAARIAEENPVPQRGWDAGVTPLREVVIGGSRTPLFVLMGAVGFVLLIACGNVANLFLARAAARRKEMAVRSAIGASRWLIGRQLLAEALVLALAGALLGLLLAYWATGLLAAAAPAVLPRVHEVTIDGRVVGFTLGVALLAVLIFSVAPAIQATRGDLAQIIRDGRKGAGGTVRSGLRNALVTTQVALSLLLLIGAGLMLRSFARLSTVDPGVRVENVLTVQVPLPPAKYDTPEKQRAFFDDLIGRVGSLTAADVVGAVSTVPLSGQQVILGIWKEGEEALPPSEISTSNVYTVNADYFRALGVVLRAGRTFSAEDRADGPGAVVISEATARAFFPGTEAVGQRLRLGGPEEELREVVGVVGDTKHSALAEPAPPLIYQLYSQSPTTNLALLVRSTRNPEALAGAIRGEVRAIDPDQPVGQVATLERIVADSIAASRFNVVLLGGFAAVALLLALVGIYGVIAYSVTQRTHEFGIQMALGATPSSVQAQVVRQAMKVTGLGIGIGVLAALLVTGVMRSLMFEVSTTDPATFGVVALAMAVVALAASYVPARRASGMDPMLALRAE